MLLTGLGTHLVVVPFATVLFEHIITATRAVGTAAFAVTVTDALGYTGAAGVLLHNGVFQAKWSASSSSAG